MDSFLFVCDELSIPLAGDKAINPCSKLIFLGLEIDSSLMMVQIPLHKLQESREILLHVLDHRKVTLREFQSMIGKLAFFGRAVRSSRAFLRRFYDAIVNIKQVHHRVRITASIRQDVKLWLAFLDQFNGVAYIPDACWLDGNIHP